MHYTYVLPILAYVIFTDKENAYTCTVDFASSTLLNGTWDNLPSFAEWFWGCDICDFVNYEVRFKYALNMPNDNR